MADWSTGGDWAANGDWADVGGGGGDTLTGTLFSVVGQFPTGTLDAEDILAGTLFSVAPTFPVGSLATDQTLSGALFSVNGQFGAGIITDFVFGELVDTIVEPTSDSTDFVDLDFDGTYFMAIDVVANRVYIFDHAGADIDVSGALADSGSWGIAFDGTDIWVVNNTDNELLRLDYVTQSVLETIPVDGDISGPAYLEYDPRDDTFWVFNFTDTEIWKMDTSGNALDSFPNPYGTGIGVLAPGFAWIDPDLWVVAGDSVTNDWNVYKIDPDDGTVIDQFAIGLSDPGGMAYDGSLLWVHDRFDDTLYGYSISGESGGLIGQLFSVVATFPTGTITGGESAAVIGWGIPI